MSCVKGMVGQVGIEPTTISLKGCCSTTELLTHRGHFRDDLVWMQEIYSKPLLAQKSSQQRWQLREAQTTHCNYLSEAELVATPGINLFQLRR